MPKDTRIDDLIAHFEMQRTHHQNEIAEIDLKRDHHQARLEAALDTLRVLRNDVEPQTAPATVMPDKPKAPRQRKVKDLFSNGAQSPDDELEEVREKIIRWKNNATEAACDQWIADILNNHGLVWNESDTWGLASFRQAWALAGRKK